MLMHKVESIEMLCKRHLQGQQNDSSDAFRRGADIGAQGGNYGSALQAVAAENHEEIVRILLEKSAEVNKEGGKYGSALQAAESGFEKSSTIAQIPLQKGADPNAQSGMNWKAL